MVTKNTLAKIAVKGTEYEALTEKLTGPIALAFGFEDPVSPAKAVTKFIKDTKKEKSLVQLWTVNCYQLKKQKHWQLFLQKKNFLQKCLDLSTLQLQVSQTLSTLFFLNLQEQWQLSEIKSCIIYLWQKYLSLCA